MPTWLEQIMSYVANQSVQIAMMVLIVAGLTFFLRNRSAHVRYLLWLMVLAKCCVPPLFYVDVPLYRSSSVETIPTPISVPLVATAAKEESMPAQETPSAGSASTVLQPEPSHSVDRTSMVAVVWLAGVVMFLLLVMGKALVIAVRLRKLSQPLTEEQQAHVKQLCSTLKLKTIPRIRQVREGTQPFVWGLPRGCIYVPGQVWTQSDPYTLQCVLTHEVCHILRMDASVNLFQILAQAVFWFHPLVWWANRQLRLEREKCCDETTIAMLKTTGDQYGQAIIETLSAHQGTHSMQSSLAIAGPLKTIEKRLRSIMKPNKQFHKRASLMNIICITLMALSVVPTAWQPTQAKADETPKRQNKPLDVKPGQILFEVSVYAVDPSFLASRKIESVDVRVDPDFAQQLSDLAKKDEQVKCESKPRVLVMEGEEGTIELKKFAVSLYPEDTGVQSGVKIILRGTIQPIKERILLAIETQQYNILKSEKANVLPMTVSGGVKGYIEVANRQPVVISGYAEAEDPGRKMIAVITPTFDKKAGATQPVLLSPGQKVDSPKTEPTPVMPPVVTMGPVERLQKRTAFIQNDSMVKALTEKSVDLELKLMEYSLDYEANNPKIQSTQKMLTMLQQRLEEQQRRIGEQFDQAVDEEQQARSTN